MPERSFVCFGGERGRVGLLAVLDLVGVFRFFACLACFTGCLLFPVGI